ncbi:hypothetical protein K435DRAFT_811993 [Dendrothele bispora CBS 962.96]|uniref:Uncharacterized protein n=1 Tax=Dendrothele bispora (strain CBS 962.96) TaxID=1314807 RepID=A0A4S8KQE7_DENBC|nr:hypothetical protein K435DRAFT_811993 [Dendrothele bispora CBS 962.96]
MTKTTGNKKNNLSIFHNQRKHLTSNELYIGNKQLHTKESGVFDVVLTDDQVVVVAHQVSVTVNTDPEPAVFSIKGEVGEFNSQLGCHGGTKLTLQEEIFRQIRPNIHSLTDATLTLVLLRPRSLLYGPEFNTAIANLDILMEARRNIEVGWRMQRMTVDSPRRGKVIVKTQVVQGMFRKLTVVSSTDVFYEQRLLTPDAITNNTKYMDPYNFEWKVHPDAKDKLAELVRNRTHKVAALQAFTFDGKHIALGSYRTKLPNCLVHIKSVMRHAVDPKDQINKFFCRDHLRTGSRTH